MSLDFKPYILYLLKQGFIYAVAHVRGGFEKGIEWYKNGILLNKKNSFDDFAACAKYLIENRFTRSDLLFANSASAGGVVMGVMANEYPFLFKGIIAEEPVTDVVGLLTDSNIVGYDKEFFEWGYINDYTYKKYIESYSPLQNLKPQSYPNIFVTTSLNDRFVPFWMPLTWVLGIREFNSSDSKVIIDLELNRGHNNGNKEAALKKIAMKISFMFKILGKNVTKLS